MRFNNQQFRKAVIHYMDTHWKEDLNLKKIANSFGYAERYFQKKFKECFSCPFGQYVTKLKLHRVAGLMIENNSMINLRQLAGFSNPQSFSKGFRKEFGMSPKQFLHSLEEIPDMPLSYEVNGSQVRVEYLTTKKMTLHGWFLPLVKEQKTNLTKERGYFIDHYDDRVKADWNQDTVIGMWRHDASCDLKYFVGKVVEGDEEAPKGMVKVSLPAEYCAKLSVPINQETKRKPALYSKVIKQIAGWAKEEWMVLNRRNYLHMASIFEMYQSNQVSLYIPVPKRTWNQVKAAEGEGTEAWTKYIDEHIMENFTIRELAEHFNYSERHFRDTFLMYYNISPMQYIKKRKLYLIAKELRKGMNEVPDVTRQYGFRSVDAFRKDFYKEFQIMPEEYEEEYRTLDMYQYYSLNKQTLKVTYEELETIEVIGKDIVPAIDKKHGYTDLKKYITYSLERTDGELMELCENKMLLEDKFIVWQTEYETEEIVCLTCIKWSEILKEKGSLWKVKLKGGVFAVLETQNDSDRVNLEHNYQLLYRCAYAGWIKENRARIDFNRLTFVRYVNEKLYFYIPVNE